MASFSKNLDIMSQVRRINAQLNTVAEKCQIPVGQTLLTQAALIASEIKSVAPVDPESDTPGALKDSVRVEEGTPTAKKAIVVRIKAGGDATKRSSEGGKPYDYGRAVEFGTEKNPPHPFFFAIWRARKKDVRAAVRKVIRPAVKDVFK